MVSARLYQNSIFVYCPCKFYRYIIISYVNFTYRYFKTFMIYYKVKLFYRLLKMNMFKIDINFQSRSGTSRTQCCAESVAYCNATDATGRNCYGRCSNLPKKVRKSGALIVVRDFNDLSHVRGGYRSYRIFLFSKTFYTIL